MRPVSSYSYSFCGLSLTSQWELPLSRRGAGEKEGASLDFTEVPASYFKAARAEFSLRPATSSWGQHATLTDGSDYVFWPELFEFLVSPDGRRIAARAMGDTPWEAFQSYLLSQVLSYALIKQGHEPLHATVVVVDGEAVGFIGDSGYGKSTLAACFIRAGHPLLTDDLLLLKECGGVFLAFPSFPRIKVFADVARTFLGAAATGVPMSPYSEKLIIPLCHDFFCERPAPLRAIFVLRPGSRTTTNAITVRTLRKRRAFLDLVANTFNRRITDPDRLKRQFMMTDCLAAAIPIKSLSYPRNLTILPDVVKTVCRELQKALPST